MGIFSKKSPEEQVAAADAKARAKAAKKGVDEGAIAVAHDLSEDTAHCTFILWPDRVEIHNHGKVGSLTGKGAGVESIPLSRVASVDVARKGVFSVVRVHGSGHSLEYRTDSIQGPRLRREVMALLT